MYRRGLPLGPFLPLLLLLLSFVSGGWSHGRLIEPPSRASAWRFGYNTPHNYNDHELYCGGFTRQWVKNDGKCGVCGDAWDSKIPRAHEYGGTYGQGVIVRKYTAGGTIKIKVELTANHFGYFQFAICPDYQNASQTCLDKTILKLAGPHQENVDHAGVKYFPRDGNKVYEMKYKLPQKSCEHCLLQWRYIAGNNWGNCPNGTGAVGCGPQEEFRACADISISGRGTEEELTPEITTAATSTLQPAIPGAPGDHESSTDGSPIAALIISLVSFLVVFLVLSLLYFHFYQVGRQIKNWLKRGGDKTDGDGGKISNLPLSLGGRHLSFYKPSPTPLPPPRNKRSRSRSSGGDGLHEIDLRGETVA